MQTLRQRDRDVVGCDVSHHAPRRQTITGEDHRHMTVVAPHRAVGCSNAEPVEVVDEFLRPEHDVDITGSLRVKTRGHQRSSRFLRQFAVLDIVCGVAVNLRSGEVLRRWRDEMDSRPFFPTGPGHVLIAHNAQAEMEAHLSLGWPLPAFVIDTMAENLLATNGVDGLPVPAGFRGSLLAAMRCMAR